MKIPYGESDYKKIKEENYLYIDKTMYLEKLENVGSKILYLKPRRFGKTLFTSMMYHYYDINGTHEFDTLFKDTYVYNNPTPYKNKYYILKFDFSGMEVNSNKEEDIRRIFNEKIKNGIFEFIMHYNLNYEILDTSYPTEQFSDFINYFSKFRDNNKLYIIIDEYDNFTNSILSSNVDMFRKILGNEGFVKAFYARIKEYCGNGIIDRVFITGVCSISLDSMTSGFNIASNITTDFRFNSMTALTHEEVKSILNKIPDSEKYFNTMLENYDGYSFTRKYQELVFNPTLTMYYIKSLIDTGEEPEDLLDSNIISNFQQLRNIISLGDYKEIIDDIFDNGEVSSTLSVNFDMDTTFNKADVISLLFYFGYLTIKESVGGIGYKFVIPNKVIKEVYGKYYLSILKKYNINTVDDREFDLINEIYDSGNINKLCEYVSFLLKNADNRIYINFKEKDLQILIYAILIKYQNINVELEYKTNDKFIDMYIKTNKFNIIVELKYIKKKDSEKYEEVKNLAVKQINEYSKVFNKDNLKKYVVIFTGSNYTIDEIK